MPRLRVRELAEERGLNISQLQRQTGLDMGMVRRYWYNEGTKGPLHEINLIALGKLAQVLGVHPGELIDPNGERTEERLSPVLAAA